MPALHEARMNSCYIQTYVYPQVHSRIVASRMQSIQALYPFCSRRTSLRKLCVTVGASILQSKFIMKNILAFCRYDMMLVSHDCRRHCRARNDQALVQKSNAFGARLIIAPGSRGCPIVCCAGVVSIQGWDPGTFLQPFVRGPTMLH